MDWAHFFNDVETLVTVAETTVKDAKATWDALSNVIADGKDYFFSLFNKPKAVVADCVVECRAMVEAHKAGKLQAASPGTINWLALLQLISKIIDLFK